MEPIYERPADYDVEHEGDPEDVGFYLRLLERWRPRGVMELAAGSGGVTIPLAQAAAATGVQIVGLEREKPGAGGRIAGVDVRFRQSPFFDDPHNLAKWDRSVARVVPICAHGAASSFCRSWWWEGNRSREI